jgi:glycosyltransferase involved in cell wall biosynthesis
MMKRMAMLLNGPIKNDYRVIKVIGTLSATYEIHLFYINGDASEDKVLFNHNVTLTSVEHTASLWVKVIRHSLFCYEFNFFKKLVLSSGENFDFIWANDLPTLYPAYKSAKDLRCKLVYDSHEIFTETINQFFPRHSTGLKKVLFQKMISFMRKHGLRMEHKIFPSVDKFLTVNESLLRHFMERNTVKEGLVIMNLPTQNQTKEIMPIDYKEKFKWDSSAVISIYQGQLNEGRGLHLLFEAIQLLPHQFKLVVVGNGSLGDALQEWAVKQKLTERIKFIETVELSELSAFTSGADLGINLLERFNLSKEYASPNKLFEYIHSEIPVVASDTIENQRVFDTYAIGQLTGNQPEKIAAAIQEVSKRKKTAFRRALLLAKSHYQWENQEEMLCSILDE